MRVRVRLGAGLAGFAGTPRLALEVGEAATVGDVIAALGEREPDLGPALRAALSVVGGAQVERDRRLAPDDEVALLIPVAGGAAADRDERS